MLLNACTVLCVCHCTTNTCACLLSMSLYVPSSLPSLTPSPLSLRCSWVYSSGPLCTYIFLLSPLPPLPYPCFSTSTLSTSSRPRPSAVSALLTSSPVGCGPGTGLPQAGCPQLLSRGGCRCLPPSAAAAESAGQTSQRFYSAV